MTRSPSSISGLADLAGRYDAVLSDVWGVVHNGVEAFPGAVEALQYPRRFNQFRARVAARVQNLIGNAL